MPLNQNKFDRSETSRQFVEQDIPLVEFRQDNTLRYRWISDPMRLFGDLVVLGKTDDELLPQNEAIVLTEVKQKALRTRRVVREIVRLTPGEKTYWLDAVVKPVIGHEEEIVGFVGAFWDLSKCIEVMEGKSWPTPIPSDPKDHLLHRHGGYAAIRENERSRLVRDLHDFLGPNLTSLNLNLNSLKIQLANRASDEAVWSTLDAVLLLADDLGDIIHNLITDLRASPLAEFGLVQALIAYQSDFTKRTGIDIVLDTESFSKLSPPMEEPVFRIIQEALNNAAKYAQAQRVVIQLHRGPDLVKIVIADDGRGFDLHQHRTGSSGRGWGLIFMEERAVSIGGGFRVESAEGAGTRIIVEVPK